ncbi:MAG: zinc ABC transporter substrate-binding protein [bacterium]
MIISKSKIFLPLFLLAVLLLAACSGRDNKTSSNKIRAVVTVITYADFVKKIGGDKVDVTTMIPPGANAHAYEPQPEQLVEFSKADFYFRVGNILEFEDIWMNKIQGYNKKIKIVDCSENIFTMEHDPHIWLSPANTKIITQHIYDAFVKSYPAEREFFETNLKRFHSELDSVDASNKVKISGLKSNKFMVYHSAWKYFAEYYGLEEIAIEKEGKSPNVRDLTDIITKAKESGIKVIFTEPQFDPSPAKTIANEIGAVTDTINSLPADYLQNLTEFVNKIVKYSK